MGSRRLGVVIGSVLIGFVEDRASFGAGFAVASAAAVLGTLLFVVAECCTWGGRAARATR